MLSLKLLTTMFFQEVLALENQGQNQQGLPPPVSR
jgi:hypothetical protein